MKISIPELKPLLKEIAEVAYNVWAHGWAERNAGNISMNVTPHIRTMDYISDKKQEQHRLPFLFPNLSEQILLMSATGSRMRELAEFPHKYMMLLRISSDGDSYSIIPLANHSFHLQPSSELLAHLAIHQQLIEEDSLNNTLLHTHITEVIALNHFPNLNEKNALNKVLLSMHPETILFLPEGAGFVPFLPPGSQELARKTLDEIKHHSVVIWEKHGVLSYGTSPANACDQLELIAKAARIYLMCRQASVSPSGLSIQQLRQLKEKNDLPPHLPFTS
ncbi:MAG TPA: rhamnulose-1-phosphate aldolase [Bacteroidales bacterium]|jgi:rhamnulose-1-phosphate aldolase|nr:rhamnulose-1-phosphate aldolase [Bacteroidales bacterium]MDI9574265.1 rhamnulose-1-phosphate aldolase [Bacteroidota bacterium]OQC59696.1 MAG: Rhamnulose-1-phosphate aldolase [Bacteroidetes bacterium ADurb.Bin012]MBP9512400.1 rhamnulose-1-phosphate aldolase [Bacteroidales bacterium]MBP9589039.1 rhamnulose-1-phosphate aldolase [Bacteroidales bacterium]